MVEAVAVVDETERDPFVVGAVVYLMSDLKRETPMTVIFLGHNSVDVTWLDVNKHQQSMSGPRAIFEEFGERDRRRQAVDEAAPRGYRLPLDPRRKDWDC